MKIAITILLLIFVFSACNEVRDSYFSKIVIDSEKDSEVVIVVHNRNNNCLGCEIGLNNFLSRLRNQPNNKKSNIYLLTKSIREIEKSSFEESLNSSDKDLIFCYDDILYNFVFSKLRVMPQSGGVIVLNKYDKVLFESSFKDPSYPSKTNEYFFK